MKLDKYKCSGCGIEVEYNGIGFEPMEHNVDIGVILLQNCGRFIKMDAFNEGLVDGFRNGLI